MGVIPMLDRVMLNQLYEMKLTAMADKLIEQQENPDLQALSFEERLGMLVDAQWLSRRNSRIDRLIRQATFRYPAVIEDIDYTRKEVITKQDIARLEEGSFILRHQNLILTGPTGVGKTYIACALGASVCRQCIAVRYIRMQDLFYALADAQDAGNYIKTRNKLAATPLLILDDWGMRPFTMEESQELLELFELRYQRHSTIVAGQLPLASWHEIFPDPTTADALLDRLVHNAHKYNLKGDSMRKAIAEQELRTGLTAP